MDFQKIDFKDISEQNVNRVNDYSKILSISLFCDLQNFYSDIIGKNENSDNIESSYHYLPTNELGYSIRLNDRQFNLITKLDYNLVDECRYVEAQINLNSKKAELKVVLPHENNYEDQLLIYKTGDLDIILDILFKIVYQKPMKLM